jgi:hypothetical protein
MYRVLRVLLAVATVLLCFACSFFMPCWDGIRVLDGEEWVWPANHLRLIGTALREYHEAYGHLPPAAAVGRDGRPLYSWRVLILPFIEQGPLHNRFHLDEPWDSPHNKSLLEEMPRYFSLPWGDRPDGMTHFQVLVGPGTAFERPGLTWKDFPDEPENTILVVEAADPVPWTKPAEQVYDPRKPMPRLGGLYTKPVHFWCREVGRRTGFGACFADGSYHFISSGIDDRTLRALITRNGGEAIDLSKLDD